MNSWYLIADINEIDSPSLVLYNEHVIYNLEKMLQMVGGNSNRLMPHIKTNKMPKVLERFVELGIKQFKASTIAEAEIAARAEAKSVLIAHQLVGPKISRFISLITHFPNTEFYTIVDNIECAKILNNNALKINQNVGIYIDINNGMDRSGIEPGKKLNDFIEQLPVFTSLHLKGFHVYDGQFRDKEFTKRNTKIQHAMEGIYAKFEELKIINPRLQLICGGTPSFTSHLQNETKICSPGTCVFWDWGYNEKLSEQTFKFAVLIVTRVISKPKKGIVTIDMGHKAVASENPIDKRVCFLNLTNYTLFSQSEEHSVLRVKDDSNIKIGDVLYGVPYHICPTINLYDDISVIDKGEKIDVWEISARKRKITI